MFALRSLLPILPLVALVPRAAAHGYIASVSIDGKEYDGPYFGEDGDGKYPIRPVNTIDPLKGADNKDLSCGPGSYPISGDESKVYAKASPGSAIDVNWMSGDGQAWPHNVGPMLTYLAQCDGGDCSTLDGKDAKWFKIEQTGLKDDGSGWVQEELMQEKPASLTLPKDLASGAYLLRHEIIALHLASEEGGAEFYAGCVQLKVDGDQTGTPTDDELVSFPGAYSDEDKGILLDPFSVSKSDYVFPGPKVAELADGGSNSGSSSGNDTSNGDDNGSGNSSGSGSSSGNNNDVGNTNYGNGWTKKNCGLKKAKRSATVSKRAAPSAEADEARVVDASAHRQPRVYSRIMRGLDWRSL
ncbi:glycosyl hydrolase family 61-domain-containing protein [Schizophyllum commune]